MTINKNHFKRRFPKMGKCVCCCCCDPEMSVKIGAFIIFVYLGISGIFDYGYSSKYEYINSFYNDIVLYTGITVIIITCISLFLLINGINKVKNLYLNQFKYVFIIFLLYFIFMGVNKSIVFFDEKYIEFKMKQLKIFNKSNVSYSNNQIRNEIIIINYVTLIIYAFIFIVMVYYYLTTCSFIEDLQEETMIEDDYRDIENN